MEKTMKSNLLKTIAIGTLALMLTNCTATTGTVSKKDTYTLGGAVVGGIIGNQFGSGSGKDAATILGVILGSQWGSNVGAKLDHYETIKHEQAAYQALEHHKDGQVVKWSNPNSGHKGGVMVTDTYYIENGQIPCRSFIQEVQIGARMEQSKGIACRTASGKWELMKDPKVKIENGMQVTNDKGQYMLTPVGVGWN
jgi:surface antigen